MYRLPDGWSVCLASVCTLVIFGVVVQPCQLTQGECIEKEDLGFLWNIGIVDDLQNIGNSEGNGRQTRSGGMMDEWMDAQTDGRSMGR